MFEIKRKYFYIVTGQVILRSETLRYGTITGTIEWAGSRSDAYALLSNALREKMMLKDEPLFILHWTFEPEQL